MYCLHRNSLLYFYAHVPVVFSTTREFVGRRVHYSPCPEFNQDPLHNIFFSLKPPIPKFSLSDNGGWREVLVPDATHATQQSTTQHTKSNMDDPIRLVDLMEVQTVSGCSVSFTILGDPPTQQRHRMAFLRGRSRPHFYDPSGDGKRLYASLVRNSFLEYGLSTPYFSPEEPIVLRLLCVLPRRQQDLARAGGRTVLTRFAQVFPRNKDVDNLLKFVMDALQGVVYRNDQTITTVIVTKTFPLIPDARGWTEVELSTSTQAPTLAAIGVWA
jgi:Holliday junction resolvase RusA-like endonuclease